MVRQPPRSTRTDTRVPDTTLCRSPQSDPDARFVETVERIDDEIMAMADARSASGLGSGGMVSKLQAARIATHAGAHLAIISGKIERPLTAFATTGRGTVFVAPPKASAKKAWLAGRLTVKGSVHIGAGAAVALTDRKSTRLNSSH